MSRLSLHTVMLVILLAASGAIAQGGAAWELDDPAPPAVEISPSRLAAGVRAYPAGVLRALFTVAEQPLLLRQLAEEPERIARPEELYPPVSPAQQAAIRELQQVPEVVALAAAYPEELAALRRLYAEAPEGMEARIAELRARYEVARLAGARQWQQQLSREPAALRPYEELLTRFCREQLREYAAFPHVVVQQREYYYACPPNELVMAYAQQVGTSAELTAALEQWWAQCAPPIVDERVLAARGPVEFDGGTELVAGWLPPQRAAMWWVPGADDAGAAALLPVIMQPLDDQPLDAQLAFAVAEQARLWAGPQLTGEAPEGAFAEAGEPAPPAQPRVLVEPDDDDEPEVVIQTVPVYVDTPTADYYDPYHDVGGDTHVYVDNYYVNSGGWPYYYSYPWTWPVIYTSYPSYYGSSLYLGYGRCAGVSYHGSRAYVSFNIGAGARAYYVCPLSRHVYRPHTRRYWQNYGAPYGGPYWRNYGAPYGDHAGRWGHQRRSGSVVVRDYDASNRRRVGVNRGAVVRPSRTAGSYGRAGVTRSPVVWPDARRVGPTSARQSIIPRSTTSSGRSGQSVIRPRSGSSTPSRGTIGRRGGSAATPGRGTTVRPGSSRSAPSRGTVVRPSGNRPTQGRRTIVQPSGNRPAPTRRSTAGTPTRQSGSSRTPAVRPYTPRRSSSGSSSVQRGNRSSGGSRVVRPSSPTRRGSSVRPRSSSSGRSRPTARPRSKDRP